MRRYAHFRVQVRHGEHREVGLSLDLLFIPMTNFGGKYENMLAFC